MAEEDDDHMTLSINGHSQVPPGFRFHPTEEELLHYYLRKKVGFQKIDLDVIPDVDLNKLEPWDIQEKCKIGSTPQNDWYFFSHKDKKYPTGTRTNRATTIGFWKATGRDKIIYSGSTRIGLRKTLVFYKGRAPHGQKSDWIMHEYRLDDSDGRDNNICNSVGESQLSEDGWVVCRVFKKKNYQKSMDSPKTSPTFMDSNVHLLNSNDGVLDQILQYMGRTCKLEMEPFSNNNNNNPYSRLILNTKNNNNTQDNQQQQQQTIDKSFMHLPRLESPTTIPGLHQPETLPFDHDIIFNHELLHETSDRSSDLLRGRPVVKLDNWVAFDRLVASQLNGHEDRTIDAEEDKQQQHHHMEVAYGHENEIWGFTKSASPSSLDPLSHLSV